MSFESKARALITTKETSLHVAIHEELMEELKEQTKLLRHLAKLLEPKEEPKPETLKVNTQKPEKLTPEQMKVSVAAKRKEG